MNYVLYASLAAVFVLLFALEQMFPAQREPFNPGWYLRALAINLFQLATMFAIVVALNPLLAPFALIHLSNRIPAPLAGLAAALLGSLIQYGWHRAAHASDFLWRMFHQIHHSPGRVDILLTNYSHPLDYAVNTLIHSFAAVVVLGLDADSIAWAVFIYGVNNYYSHCNLRSPRWLGYLLQRPEMHRIHHKLGHHAQNYGFPVWDMLFGTWVNPSEREDFAYGFGGNREERLWSMLVGRDVNRTLVEADASTVTPETRKVEVEVEGEKA